MPEYAYRCLAEECDTRFFQNLALVNRNAPQACPSCQGASEKLVPEGVGGVLQGDVWPGKNIRVKNEMADRRKAVGEREKVLKMDGPQFQLAPNVGGERVDSWSEAAKMASSLGKDSSGYEKRAAAAAARGKKA